jgi:hypothetical protein
MLGGRVPKVQSEQDPHAFTCFKVVPAPGLSPSTVTVSPQHVLDVQVCLALGDASADRDARVRVP